MLLTHPYVWPEVRRGAERYLRDLSRHLRERGHRVRVLATADGDVPAHGSDVPHVFRSRRAWRRLVGLGVDPSVAFVPTMLAGMLGQRPELVHALSPADGAAAVLARRRPVVTTLTGIPFRWWHERSAAAAAAWSLVIGRADAVVCISTFAARVLEVDYGRRAEVVPPGVDTEVFRPDGKRRDPATIVFVGALDEPRKRIDLLMRAFAGVAGADGDVRLLVTGHGDPRRALAARDAVPPDVRRRVGVEDVPTEDLPRLYASAAVTVLPSRNEAFGLTLAESLACGTPVVGTDEGGIVDVIDDEGVGRRFAPDDADDLARALGETLELAADPATRGRCRTSAMRFDWRRAVGPALESVYARVLGR